MRRSVAPCGTSSTVLVSLPHPPAVDAHVMGLAGGSFAACIDSVQPGSSCVHQRLLNRHIDTTVQHMQQGAQNEALFTGIQERKIGAK
eukprot:COSAG02_NODE_4311_length_5525_cov_15.117888_5_plen_88_part_00